ncbi:MAG: ABC transporter substrate-binding protein [Thermodesulfovibrionia bacterium]|nr:ABC transporter substrate-binding protein [Thermodesulfovibrionia bacterium]
MKLRIGYLPTFYHTSILLIARGNIENALGIEVDWTLFGTGPAIVEAFDKRALDLAYIGLPPAIIGIDKGTTVRCIAGGHVEGTVVCGTKQFKGYPGIKELDEILKQFVGYKIGVPGKGSIHDVILADYLERFQLKKDIEVINFQWADQIIDEMHKGRLSAAVGTPALAVAVQRYADGKMLYPPSKIWPNNPSYGILVSDDFLRKKLDIVKKFLKLHEEASLFFKQKPVETAEIIADCVGFVDKGFVLDTLKISPKYCAQITDDYISSTMDFVRVMKRLGYINREIPCEEIFDTSLIKKSILQKTIMEKGYLFLLKTNIWSFLPSARL